jgi:hypothetical protein
MPHDTETPVNATDESGSRLPLEIEASTPEAMDQGDGQDDLGPTIAVLGAYQPSGKVTFLGILLMPLLGAAGAWVGSYLHAFFYHHLCTLVVIFPLVTGGIAGLGVALGVHWGKIRNVKLAMSVGLALGLLAFGMTYFWGYRNLSEYARSYVLETDGIRITEEEARELIDEILMEETNHTGVYGYALFSWANSHFSFFRVGSTTFDAYDLEANPNWLGKLVAIVEWLAAGVGGLLVGSALALRPFCEEDKRWLRYEIILRSNLDNATDLTEPLIDGRYGAMLEFLVPPSQNSAFTIEIYYCPACRDGYLEAIAYVRKDRTLLCRLELNPQQVDELLKLQKDAAAVLKAKEQAKAEPVPTEEKT